MKVIRLKNVHYVSKEGITLTLEKPSIEATEENVKKLEYFIKEKYLEIVDLDKEVLDTTSQEKASKIEISTAETKSEEHVVEEVKEPEAVEEVAEEATEEKPEKKSKRTKK